MFYDITKANYLNDYNIELFFEDGGRGMIDLSDYLDSENVFKAFSDLEYFKNFKIEYGTLVWGNGELDIAPETLYTKATGKQIEYENWQSAG